MVRRVGEKMGIVRRRLRSIFMFCSIMLGVRTGMRTLVGFRSQLRRRSLMSQPYMAYSDFERSFDARAYPVYGYSEQYDVRGYLPEEQNFYENANVQQMLPYQMDASNLQVVPVQQAEPVQMQAQEIKPISVVQEPVEVPVEPQVPVEVPVPSPAAVKPAPVEEQKLTFIPRVASNQILPQQNDNVAKSTVAPLSAGVWDYDGPVDPQIEEHEKDFSIPNANFIFHNKLPKSGSTTMHDILRKLSQKNLFNYKKMDSSNMDFDDDASLVDYIKENQKTPFFYMQHHFFTNFTSFGLEQPTMINVIREPLDWFSSHYHFKLYGWSRKPGQRGEGNEMSLEECVSSDSPTCSRNHWRYIEFFCGNGPDCQLPQLARDDDVYKSKMVEIAKRRMLDDYFVVGVLEQFEDSLSVFEKLLPRYYRGALEVYESKMIQTTRNQTKSIGKRTLPDEVANKLRSGALKYELDLYQFARQLFNKQMQALNIPRYQRATEL